MAFKISNLSPETAERLTSLRDAARRLHAMTDPFLARNVLRLARRARQEDPDRLGNPTAAGYEVGIVWQIAPLLAKRVAGCDLQPNEGRNPRFVSMSAYDLRICVGTCLNNSALGIWAHQVRSTEKHVVMAMDFLGREFVNGNPVAMLTDRFCAPRRDVQDSEDWLATHMREISRSRFGDERFDQWPPDFDTYQRGEVVPLSRGADEEFSF